MPNSFVTRASWVAGASFYWTYILLLIGVPSGEGYAGIPTFLALIFLGTNALTATVLALCAHFYNYLPSKKLLVILLGAIGIFDFIVFFIIGDQADAGFVLFFLATSLRGLRAGVLMQLWGLKFAKASVDEVSSPVFLTAFFSTALFLMLFEAGSTLSGICFFALPLLSSAALVFVRSSAQVSVQVSAQIDPLAFYGEHVSPDSGIRGLEADQHKPDPGIRRLNSGKRKRFRFFASRALYGIGIGLVLGLVLSGDSSVHEVARDGSPGIFVGALVLALTLACFVLMQKRKIIFRSHWLVMLPVVSSGLITVVAATDGASVFLRVITASTWLCWIVLSSAQIPVMGKILRMGKTTLALLEKVVVVLPWFITRLLLVAFDKLVVIDPTGKIYAFETTLSIIFSYLILLAAVISLTRFTLYSVKASADETRSAEFRESPEDARHAIAMRFRLTPREKEVFSLLAAGRNRAYIQKQLYISEGTAKTHINHIHQKLGVSTQQELLDLVNVVHN